MQKKHIHNQRYKSNTYALRANGRNKVENKSFGIFNIQEKVNLKTTDRVKN